MSAPTSSGYERILVRVCLGCHAWSLYMGDLTCWTNCKREDGTVRRTVRRWLYVCDSEFACPGYRTLSEWRAHDRDHN